MSEIHVVRKVNIDTGHRLAMAGAIRKFGVAMPAIFHPRNFMIPATEAMTGLCRLGFEQFGIALSRWKPITNSYNEMIRTGAEQ